MLSLHPNKIEEMKKTALLFAVALFIISCSQSTVHQEGTRTETELSVDSDQVDSQTEDNNIAFNIENIPYSNSDIGDFPFFTLPEGLTANKNPLQKNFDVCFFPINGTMTPFEGKLYKANISAERGEEFSQRYFEKSMEDYLTSIGAVKVYDGEITKEEYERYNKQDPNKGDDGDIGYWNEQIKFYVIRTKEQGNIYIQYSANNASGKLNILQEETFKQTMTKVTADDILKDLNEKGKSILYINFDVDKSSISSEGSEVIAQITEALKKDNNLKIAIEGHTDNTGDAVHNKNLSDERAKAVMNSLTTQGIDKSRLSAEGFGAERPLAVNDSEENKAKNRRVELIRVI